MSTAEHRIRAAAEKADGTSTSTRRPAPTQGPALVKNSRKKLCSRTRGRPSDLVLASVIRGGERPPSPSLQRRPEDH